MTDAIINHGPAKSFIEAFLRFDDDRETLVLQGPESYGKSLLLRWAEHELHHLSGITTFRADSSDTFFHLLDRIADFAPQPCGSYAKTRRKNPLHPKWFQPRPKVKVTIENSHNSNVSIRQAGASELSHEERSYRARLYVRALRDDFADQAWGKRVFLIESFDRASREFQTLFARYLACGLERPDTIRFIVAAREDSVRAFPGHASIGNVALTDITNPDDVVAYWGGALAGQTDLQTRKVAKSLIDESKGAPHTLALLARVTRNAMASANDDADGVTR